MPRAARRRRRGAPLRIVRPPPVRVGAAGHASAALASSAESRNAAGRARAEDRREAAVRKMGLLGLALLVACGRRPSAADAQPQPPTAEECRGAIANLNRLSPGSAGDADLAECQRLPRAAVMCVTTARSAADAQACVQAHARSRFGRGGSETAEPVGAVTFEECRDAVAAVRRLRPEVKESDADLTDECVRSATPGDVKCLTAAKTMDEIKRCGLFGLE